MDMDQPGEGINFTSGTEQQYVTQQGSYDTNGAHHYSKHHAAERMPVQVMDCLIEVTAIFLIVFSPIAFGATERWSRLVVEAGVCSMCALWCFRGVLKHKLAFAKSPLNLLIAGFIVLACLQLVPLPGFLASRLSPATVYAQRGNLPGANEASIAADQAVDEEMQAQDVSASCVSVNRSAGRSSLYLVAAYAIAFLVIVNTYRRRTQISRLLSAVVVVGFVVAMLGILGCVAPNGKILWVRQPPSGAVSFGPFVNRNHFAGYLAMVAPIALGMMIGIRSREKKTLFGFAAAVMAAAVFLSASRGGVMGLAAGFMAFGLMLVASRAAKKNFFPLVLVGCVAIGGAAFIGIGPLISRGTGFLAGNPTDEYRLALWSNTTRLISAFPILGTGLGSFRHVFPIYKTIRAQLLFTHAENDYLQLLAETGIVGFTIGMVFIAMILRNSLRSFKGKRSSYSRGLMIGLTAALFAMLAHSLVDFNLHVPSNGLLFAIILAVLVVFGSIHVSARSGRSSWSEVSSRRLLKGETIVAPGTMGAFCMSLAILCLLAFCVASSAGGFFAEKELDSVEQRALQFVKGEGDFNVADGIRTVQAAISKDRENGEWHFRAGLFYQTLGQVRLRAAEGSLGRAGAEYFYKLAINEFKIASRFDRFNSRYKAVLAVAYDELGNHANTDAAFRCAARLNPTNAWVYRKYGNAVWDEDRDTAQEAFRRALDLDPHYTRSVLSALAEKTEDPDQLGKCIPNNSETVFEYAKFLLNSGLPEESEKVLLSVLAQVESDSSRKHLAASMFFMLGQMRKNNGLNQNAAACFLKAVALQPDKHAYYEELGYTHLRQKRYDAARRFLEQRLRMSPAEDGHVFLALAEVYENVGPIRTANQYYRRALRAFPPSWKVSRNEALRGLERTADQ